MMIYLIIHISEKDKISQPSDSATLRLYMKSSFPKYAKRQSKNRGCNGNAKFGDHVLGKDLSINM